MTTDEIQLLPSDIGIIIISYMDFSDSPIKDIEKLCREFPDASRIVARMIYSKPILPSLEESTFLLRALCKNNQSDVKTLILYDRLEDISVARNTNMSISREFTLIYSIRFNSMRIFWDCIRYPMPYLVYLDSLKSAVKVNSLVSVKEIINCITENKIIQYMISELLKSDNLSNEMREYLESLDSTYSTLIPEPDMDFLIEEAGEYVLEYRPELLHSRDEIKERIITRMSKPTFR